MKLVGILTVGIAIFMSTTSYAQEERAKKSPEERATHITTKMSEALSLSEQKTTQLQEINEQFVLKMKDIKSNDDMTKEQKKEGVKKLKNEHDATLKNLLSDEEYEKLKSLQQERRQSKEKKGNSPNEKAKLQTKRLDDVVQLSADQNKKIEAINLRSNMKIEALKSADNIDDVEKKEKVKQVQKNRKKAIKSLLTEDQQEKLKEHKKKHPEKGGKQLKK